MVRSIAVLTFILFASGCVTTFKETHYFKSSNQTPTNYFRLKVSGSAWFSSARYVSGCFDEQAVDMYFNEIKAPQNQRIVQAGAGASETIAKEASGKKTASYELDSCKKPGAFIMILSTNADSVANVIGSFAESNIAAEAITNLVNRNQVREIRRLDAEASATDQRLAAVSTELQGLFDKIQSDPKADRAPTEQAFVRILNTIGRELGAPTFERIDDANAWLTKNKARFAGGE